MIIILTGEPQAQPRHKVCTRGGRVFGYDPASKIKADLALQLVGQKITLLEGPVYARITFYMPIRASMSKKKKASLKGTHHVKKPDIDNLQKLYFDLLEGIAYTRDSQIAEVTAKKVYDTDPRVEIELLAMSGT